MEKSNVRIAIPSGGDAALNYRAALAALGAEPALVERDCEAENFDGLLLPGGGDLAPWRFGQENCGSEEIDEELDTLQFAVLDRFVKAGKPVLGICRGHQVINVYFGGDLVQDLGVKNACHRRVHGQDRLHLCRAEADSWIGALYGTEFVTNSAHHQAVGCLGTGLRAVSWSEDDVVEALAHEKLPVCSVQWHPERLCFAHANSEAVDGSRVLQWFLELHN